MDESDHLTLVNAGDEEVVSQEQQQECQTRQHGYELLFQFESRHLDLSIPDVAHFLTSGNDNRQSLAGICTGRQLNRKCYWRCLRQRNLYLRRRARSVTKVTLPDVPGEQCGITYQHF